MDHSQLSVIAKAQRSVGSGRFEVGVASSANAHSPPWNDLRPSSVEHGDDDDGQEVKSPHGGVLESRVRLWMMVWEEGMRMRFWDVRERCRVV